MNWGLVVLLLACVHLAVSEPHAGRRRELLQRKKVENSQELVIAVTDGNLTDVVRLLDKERTNPVADVNTTNSAGATVLMVAAGSNSVGIVLALLASGADVGAFVIENGYSALHFAAAAGAKETAEKLINVGGARVDSKTFHNGTPLYIAAQHGQSEMMELLIEEGADVNAMVVNGAPPLLIAAEKGHVEAMRVLIEKGADAKKGSKDDVTALHLVVSNLNVSEPIELLLDAGLEVDVEDRWGDTPLDYAAHFGNEEAVYFLIGKGAQISKPDIRDNLPLRSICRCKGSEDFRGQLNCPEGTCDKDAVERLRAKLDPELQDSSIKPVTNQTMREMENEQGQDKAEGAKRKKIQRKPKKRNKSTRKEKGEILNPEQEKPPKEPKKLESKKPKNVKKSTKDQTSTMPPTKRRTSPISGCEDSCWKNEKRNIKDCQHEKEEVNRQCVLDANLIPSRCHVKKECESVRFLTERSEEICEFFEKDGEKMVFFDIACVKEEIFVETCKKIDIDKCVDGISTMLGTLVDQSYF